MIRVLWLAPLALVVGCVSGPTWFDDFWGAWCRAEGDCQGADRGVAECVDILRARGQSFGSAEALDCLAPHCTFDGRAARCTLDRIDEAVCVGDELSGFDASGCGEVWPRCDMDAVQACVDAARTAE